MKSTKNCIAGAWVLLVMISWIGDATDDTAETNTTASTKTQSIIAHVGVGCNR